MNRWIVNTFIILGITSIAGTYLLGTIGVSWTPISILMLGYHVTGILTVNKIIEVKEAKAKKKTLDQKYLNKVNSKIQIIKDSNNNTIKAEEYVPINEKNAFRIVRNNEYYENQVDIIEDKLQPLEEKIMTTQNKEEQRTLQNEAVIYQFMLQDTLLESKKTLTKKRK